MSDPLQQAIAAARGGRKDEARAQLMAIVAADEENAQAWLWLSGVVEDPQDVRLCLENVLELQPDHPQARQGLEWLLAQHPYLATPPAPLTSNGDAALAHAEERMADAGERLADARFDPTVADVRPTPTVADARVSPTVVDARPVPVAPARLVNDPLLCPYCGAQTSITQHDCPTCRASLMVRATPHAKPSRTHGLLVQIWQLSIGWWLGTAVVFALLALVAYQAQQFAAASAARSPLAVLAVAVALLLPLAGAAALAGQLRARTPWARTAAIGAGLALGLAGGLVLALGGAAGIAGWLAAAAVPQPILALLPAAAAIMLASLILMHLGAAALAARCETDFLGPLERFRAIVQAGDPTAHYNNGVAYKNRGMWHMAIREWEQARTRDPNDINLLRGLALAYARLNTFDRARELLNHALRVAPQHAMLTGDLAVVEELAKKPRTP